MLSFRNMTACWIGWSSLAFIPTTARAQNDDLAIDGYCPVSYHTLNKAVLGGASFASTYKGFTYRLADAETKARFDADPQKYVPQLGGLCTTALGGPYGNRFSADPTVFRIHEGKLYLYSSERAARSFDKDPAQYITTGMERFSKPSLGGHCPVSYVTQGKPVKGDQKYADTYAGSVYHFADQAAHEAFTKEPLKYAPAFDGFCVVGIGNEKRFPSDPAQFVIKDGKLYFFFDEKAKKAFEANPSELLQKADAQWPALRHPKPGPMKPPSSPRP